MLTHAVGRDPGAPVRHPGRRRLRRLRHAVAVVAAAGRARHHAGQGRPPDRLAAPPADRRPAGPTPRPTSPRCSSCTTASSPSSTALGRLGWVEDGVRGAAHPADGRDRPGARLDQAQGRPVAARQGPRPSPRPWRRGGSGRPRRRTRRSARCCPTWPSSASPSASRRRSTSWPRPAASTSATGGAASAARSSPPSPPARRAEPPAVPDAVDELDRSKRPAVTLVSAWVSQVARDARIDTALLATRADLVADHPRRPRRPAGPRLAGRADRRRHHPPDGRPRRPDVRRPGQPAPDRRLTSECLLPTEGHRRGIPARHSSRQTARTRDAAWSRGCRRRGRRRRPGCRRRGSGGARRGPG